MGRGPIDTTIYCVIKHKFTKAKTHALCYRFRGNFRNFKTHVKFGKFDSNFVKGALVPLVSTYPPWGWGGVPGLLVSESNVSLFFGIWYPMPCPRVYMFFEKLYFSVYPIFYTLELLSEA